MIASYRPSEYAHHACYSVVATAAGQAARLLNDTLHAVPLAASLAVRAVDRCSQRDVIADSP